MTTEAATPVHIGDVLTVRSGGAILHVVHGGKLDGPAVVFVHGYPDAHGCWDELSDALAERFHVVAYDVRGMGASTAPGDRDAFALPALADDLEAVIDAVSPDAPVHLVGHDWGAFQCWELITREGASRRVASLTAVAGPRVDAAGGWALRRLRPSPSALAQLAGQARRSWYIGAFMIPRLPELALSRGMERAWPQAMRRLEGIKPRPGHPAPSIADDARTGLALYRTNMRGTARTLDPAPSEVAVQLIVPTRDRYISAALYDDAERWATRVWRRDLRSGHWAQRSHPGEVARAIRELVDHLEGGTEAPPLRRARYTGRREGFAGQLAVVTGAGGGIGRATALALNARGAEVIAADINLSTAQETAAAAENPEAGIHPVKLDVADGAAMERFASDVAAEYGVPSIVINNAGVGIGGPFLDTTLTDWERIIDINLWGVIHGSRLFSRLMVDVGVEGQIVNLASAAAYTPSRALPAYSTTKAAVLMLSECMRAELAGAGIGVTAICPGIVNTNITRTTHMVGVFADEEARMQQRTAQAYGRRNYPPEKVARAILRAIERDTAVVPVTPEARVMLTLSQLTPGLVRRAARLDPSRVGG